MNASPPVPPNETRLVRVRGRVQGVGFRDGCMDGALRFGVAGWVRNRSDGTVEALLHGPAERLDALQRWLRHAIAAARVEAIDAVAVETPDPPPTRFERRPTA